MKMKNNLIKISILIPTYNRSNYLKQAIESSLSQTYGNIEVIVSDNASIDDTEEICKKYFKYKNFKYYRNKTNVGMCKNWRKLLFDYSKGDFGLILSDDDYLIDKNHISNIVKLIKKYKNPIIIHSNYKLLFDENKKFKTIKRNLPEFEIGINYFRNFPIKYDYRFMLCATFFNLNIAKEINSFDNDKLTSADWELFLKICLYGNVVFSKNVGVVYRKHNNSVTSNSDLNRLIYNYKYIISVYNYYKKIYFKTNKKELEKWKNIILIDYFDSILAFVILKKNRKLIFNYLITIYRLKEFNKFYFIYWKTLLRLLLSLNFKLDLYLRNFFLNKK